jgi:acyl carrier protein
MTQPVLIDKSEIRARVIHILEDITKDWDFDYAGPINEATRLIGDLGCESIDFVMLIVSIEGAFERKNLPFEGLLMKDGRFVGDVTVDQIVTMLQRELGGAIQ